MASLNDFMSSGPSPALTEESLLNKAGNASVDYGINASLLQRNYETRTLPDIVNRQAGRAAFFSSATGEFGDRAKEDYLTQQGQNDLSLQRTMADLTRSRILAQLGVSI